MAESYTKPAREKQGALCVAIHLPTHLILKLFIQVNIMTWLEVKGRNCNSIVSVILPIIRLPYSVPFTGWVWFGIVVFNWQIVPWFVLTPVFFWSFICSRAATESAEIIKSDVRENGGLVETRHEIQMILWYLIQYPTFLTAT